MSASQAIKLTPGQQLSAARKRSGKSLAEVAIATRIFESRLEAIERDDYNAAGPAAPYIIGYVKAYAKFIGVIPEPLVKVLESHFSQQNAILEKNQPVVEKKPTFTLLPWLAAGVAVAIFIGLGKWFFAGDELVRAQSAINSETAIANQMSARVDTEAMIKSRDETTPLTLRDNNLMPRELLEEQALEQPLDGDVFVEAEPVGEYSESPVVPSSENVRSEDLSVGLPAERSAQTSDENVLVQPAVIGDDVLSLQFSGECWLEVYSADGNRLASKLVVAGDSINLVGKAPFDIKLGDATVAAGEVNGRTLDLVPKPGRRVLRIQVGP